MAKQAQEQSPDTLLSKEITEIQNYKDPFWKGKQYYDIILHTREHDVGISLLQSIEITRWYNLNVGDYILVSFTISAKEFVTKIYPYRNDLEVTILTDYKDKKREPLKYRYKFVLTSKFSSIDQTRYAKMSPDDLGKSEVVHMEGQCVLREILGLRTLFTQGIYRNETLQNIITAEMVDGMKKVKVEANTLEPMFDMRPAVNDQQYGNVIVPTGVPLLSLPSYLQNNEYGIYNGSIGTYMQYVIDPRKNRKKPEPCLFVYPLYDHIMYEKNAYNRLQIIYNSDAKYDWIEETYAVEDGVVKILARSESKCMDNGDAEQSSAEDGYISFNPLNIMRRPVEVTDDDVTVNKEDLLVGSIGREKEDKINKTKYIPPDSNLYKHRSNIYKKTLSVWHIIWNRANIDLIVPGMPVCLIRESRAEGILKSYGTVQGLYWKFNSKNKTGLVYLIITVQKKSIYVKKPPKKE